VEATPPWAEPGLAETFITVWQVSPALYPGDPELYTALNRGLVAAARATTAADYAGAVFRMQSASRRIVEFCTDFDIVLTPTLALPPVAIGWQEEGVDGALAQLMRNVAFTPFTASPT
jgi:amidase